MQRTFTGDLQVQIIPRRWDVTFKIIELDGTVHEFVASADSSIADSGIFFGTLEEYDETTKDLY